MLFSAYAGRLPPLRRLLFLAALAALAACRVPRPVVPSEESRIARIEENLLPAVMIEGKGGGRPLTERMQAHRVSGVALAVLDEARVIWTRGHGDATPGTRFPARDLGVALSATASVTEAGDALAALARTAPSLRREAGGHALYYDPASGHGAVVMTSSAQGGPLAAEILRAVAAEYGWRDVPGPVVKKVAAVPPDKLADYPGRYLVGDLEIAVALEDGRLTVVTPDGEAAELHAAGDDRFFLLDRDTTFTFDRDPSGRVTAVTASVSGRPIRATRL